MRGRQYEGRVGRYAPLRRDGGVAHPPDLGREYSTLVTALTSLSIHLSVYLCIYLSTFVYLLSIYVMFRLLLRSLIHRDPSSRLHQLRCLRDVCDAVGILVNVDTERLIDPLPTLSIKDVRAIDRPRSVLMFNSSV